jgi:hypothetical protein
VLRSPDGGGVLEKWAFVAAEQLADPLGIHHRSVALT